MDTDPGTNALKDAAERVARARVCDRDAVFIGISAGALAFPLVGDYVHEGLSLLVMLVVGLIAHRLSKSVLYRVRGLGWLPLFGNALPDTVSPSMPTPQTTPASSETAATVPEPRSALVPRLAFATTWPATWIVCGKVSGVVTLRGGLPGKHDDMPLGVLLFTERGLAFLPESRDWLEEKLGELPAALATHVAGELFKPVQVAEAWKDRNEVMDQPKTLGEWVERALAQKNAFAISWGDLTSVMVGQTHTVLTRRTADGAEEDFIILDASPSWPGLMMQKRIVADLMDVVFMKILQPKCDELLPAVRRELGNKSEVDVRAEAMRRATDWYKQAAPSMEKFVRDAMGETLEGYAWLPNVVANQPWLFEKKTQEST